MTLISNNKKILADLVSGAVDVYLGSLAEKIQKEGLVEDFPQSWTNHLSLWQKFSQKAQNEVKIKTSQYFGAFFRKGLFQ